MLVELLCFFLGATSVINAEYVVVKTKSGKVQGQKATFLNKTIDTFLGIPFAEPPTGPLRFQRPVERKKWDDVKSTLTLPNSCFQMIDMSFERHPGVDMWNANTEMNEDCLYLNIWTPNVGSSSKKAVLVWIFGGGFFSGSSTLEVYNGGDLAALNDVVVVSMNYRVGPLGFLYAGDDSAAPGNMGLLDQQMSMQWIHNNIESFGGDKARITIFGESAGAVSIGFHLLSPKSKDLFTRASILSGSATSYWGIHTHEVALKRSKMLAEEVQCSGDLKSEATIKCLQRVDAKSITDKQWNVVSSDYFDPPFSAVVDGYFLPEHPTKTIEKGNIKRCDILGGAVSDEGYFWLVYGLKPEFPYQLDTPIPMSGEEFSTTIDKIVAPYLQRKRDKVIKDAIVFQYNNSVLRTVLNMSYRDILDDLSGDLLFTCSVADFLHKFAEMGQNVYMYHFNQRSSNNHWPKWMGVLHGYELEFLFGWPLNDSREYTKEEMELSMEMMRYWGNFAKTGDPNHNENEYQTGAPAWPKYSAEKREYVVLEKPDKPHGYGYRHEYCSFWKDFVPKLKMRDRKCVNSTDFVKLQPYVLLLSWLLPLVLH